MTLITDNQTTVVLEPGKQSLHLPPFFKSPQGSAILCRRLFSVVLMRGDQLYATFFRQPAVQFITVIGAVANDFIGKMLKKTGVQCLFNQRYFMRSSTGSVNGDRKTKSVCEAHNFGAFALFNFAHTIAPFLAGANVPSINPSLRSIPPRSFKSWAKAVRILAKTPDSVHRWKCRWQVLLGGYRSGISAHWAPVRKIQRIPLRTARESCGGRPDIPGSALGFGIYSTIRCHCSFVRSITHISALTYLIIEVLG